MSAHRKRTRVQTKHSTEDQTLIRIGNSIDTLAERRVGKFDRVRIEHEGEEYEITPIAGGGIEVRSTINGLVVFPDVSNVISIHTRKR